MKKTKLDDVEDIILILQDEIRRSHEARYDHRLHAVLLVAQGMSSRKAAQILGDSPRTVAYWVKRFNEEGLAGLAETDRPGRPGKLSQDQIDLIGVALRKSPSDYGLVVNLWDGKTLSAFIKNQFGVDMGVRQCQRLFRRLGFRLRKPRPKSALANTELQWAYKKNSCVLE